MRTPSRYIFRLPSHEINPFRATLLLILLICAVLAGVSWLILSFVRTGNTFIFWLTLFIGYLIAIAKQEKIKLIEKRQIMADKRQGLSICQFARQFFPPHRRYMGDSGCVEYLTRKRLYRLSITTESQ